MAGFDSMNNIGWTYFLGVIVLLAPLPVLATMLVTSFLCCYRMVLGVIMLLCFASAVFVVRYYQKRNKSAEPQLI
jgi:uncharacterized membrane protein YesL